MGWSRPDKGLYHGYHGSVAFKGMDGYQAPAVGSTANQQRWAGGGWWMAGRHCIPVDEGVVVPPLMVGSGRNRALFGACWAIGDPQTRSRRMLCSQTGAQWVGDVLFLRLSLFGCVWHSSPVLLHIYNGLLWQWSCFYGACAL